MNIIKLLYAVELLVFGYAIILLIANSVAEWGYMETTLKEFWDTCLISEKGDKHNAAELFMDTLNGYTGVTLTKETKEAAIQKIVDLFV